MDKIKVLIIDDEMEFASTLAERLEIRDFDSKAVEGAEEALAIFGTGWIPEVTILDLKMPGIDGLAALGMIKQRDSSIEVIMLTGHGSTASGIEGMKRGLFDYLMKPVDIGELVTRVNDAAQKKRNFAAQT
jgi:DNA-binding NtrC family response regulator